MRLIGLIGKARSGKDTVGDYARNHFGAMTLAFASPMKHMLRAAFPEVDFYGGDREQPIEWLGKSPRQLMQTLGTEWGRSCVHPELWTLLAERQIERWRNENVELAVVTDVRFHNEADMILRRGGELWHILRNNTPGVNEHISESADWQGVPRRMLYNDGTLDQLYCRLDDLFGELPLEKTA